VIISAIRQAVIDEAMTWLRTPYMSHQRVKGAGTDCAMFPLAVYASLGLIDTPDPLPKYSPYWHLHRSEEMYLQWVQQLGGIEIVQPMPADFAVFKVGRAFAHGAIVLDWPNCIHSQLGMGVVMDDLSQGKLGQAAKKFFSIVKE
jgi:cell wall-associated NlpC family hydrolase